MAGVSKKPGLAVGLTIATVLAMAITRAQVRLLTLAPYFSPANLPVKNEISPLLMFVVALAVGLAAIAYMLKVYAKSAPKTAGRG